MAAKQLLLYPVALLAVEIAAVTLMAGFTPPSSAWRLALLPLLSAAVCASIVSCTRHFQQRSLATFVAGQQATYLMQYIDVVLLDGFAFDCDAAQRAAATPTATATPDTATGASRTRAACSDKRLDAADNPPPSSPLLLSPARQQHFWARLRFGWAACTAFRHCGTPFEIKPLRPRLRYFSSFPSSSTSPSRSSAAPGPAASSTPASSLAAKNGNTDASYHNIVRDSSVPSRTAYVRHALAQFCFCYFVLDLFDLAGRISHRANGVPDLIKALFAPELVPLLARAGGRVTAAQLAVRVASTCAGLLGTYSLINGVWSLYAVAAVGILGADVRRWPLIFGRVPDAYTLRRFWG